VADNQVSRPDGAEAARLAVREMAARKADMVKIWLDDAGRSLPAKVTPEVYLAVIDEAHKNGLRVAAHIFDLDDAKAIVRAGVDIIAHGVRDKPVDAEFIDMMKARSLWYIATIVLDYSNFERGADRDRRHGAATRLSARRLDSDRDGLFLAGHRASPQ
jgi:imidazolonepropionase-like amidohydrolase